MLREVIELDDIIFSNRKYTVVMRGIDVGNSREITKCWEYREVLADEKTRESRRLTSAPGYADSRMNMSCDHVAVIVLHRVVCE